MGIAEISRRQVRAIAVIATAVMVVVVVAVATWAPWTPQPSLSPSPSPLAPSPTPLGGATDADALPDCDPDLDPQPADPTPVTPPVAGPVELRLVGQLGGAATTATLLGDGDELFAGSGSRVVRVDLSDPRSPREIGSSTSLSGTVEHVADAGDLLAVAVGDGGIAMLDPAAGLAVRSSLALPGHAEALAVEDSIAYVADGPGGLRVVDLRDPAAPVEIATLFDLHRIMDVAVDGGRVFVAAADEGLILVDVSDPTAPEEMGRLFTGGYATGVAGDGDHVLLADGWAGLRVIDVADPKAPRLVATVPVTAWAMDVEFDGSLAHLAAGAEFRILDLTDPDRPVDVGSLPLPGGHAFGLNVRGDRAVVIDDTAGIRILDVGTSPPVELGTYAPLAPSNGLAVIGDAAFVAAKGQGLHIVDISDPVRPSNIPGIRTLDLVTGVAAVGSNLFMTITPKPGRESVGGIVGMEASVPERLVPEALFGEGSGTGMAVDGSSLFIAAERGMWILDARAPVPCEFVYLDTASLGFETNGVTVAGDFAYIAPFYEEIRVVDVSDPRAPVVLDVAGESGGVGVGKTLAVGERLYAIGRDGEGPVVAAYDLGVPTTPRLMGVVPLPAATATADQNGPQMAYSGGYLFIAGETGGLVVIDVSNPSRPAIAGRLRLPGDAVGVAVDGEHAYVASDGGGFFVVEWAPGGTASASDHDQSSLAALRQQAPEPASAPGAGTPCLVTTPLDSGPGSLRGCLEQAQSGTSITFDPSVFPPDRPEVVRLDRSLPKIVDADVRIDGSRAGVIIDGGGKVPMGLMVTGDGNIIRGLQVTGFTEAGIFLAGATNTVIGGANARDRNVISGNGTAINLKEANGSTIQGNYIGTDAGGSQAVRQPGAQDAIMIGVGSGGNRVVGNVLAGTVGVIDPGSSYNAIVGNLMGVDASGSRPLESGAEIVIDEPFNQVGGTLPGEGNIINGRIVIQATDVLVLGNRLGVDEGGNPLGSGSISVTQPRAIIGGRSSGAANVIVGGGIEIRSDSNVLLGNRLSQRERPPRQRSTAE